MKFVRKHIKLEVVAQIVLQMVEESYVIVEKYPAVLPIIGGLLKRRCKMKRAFNGLLVFTPVFMIILLYTAIYFTEEKYEARIEELERKARVAEEAQKWKEATDKSRSIVVRTKEIDFDDLYLLARLVESEAGNESYETKMMVASVVMNRVADSRFPNTIKEVVYQKGQFEVTSRKVNGVLMIDREPSLDSLRVANDILNKGSILPSNVLVFYQKGVDEGWVTSRTTHLISDDTVFAYTD